MCHFEFHFKLTTNTKERTNPVLGTTDKYNSYKNKTITMAATLTATTLTSCGTIGNILGSVIGFVKVAQLIIIGMWRHQDPVME